MVQKISVISVKTQKSNTSKGITSSPENFHWEEPSHFNSPWNHQVFHTNGKYLLPFFLFVFTLSPVSKYCPPGLAVHPILCLLQNPRAICWAVTNISSCRVNTTCWWEIRQQWISFGSVFLLVNHEISKESHAS